MGEHGAAEKKVLKLTGRISSGNTSMSIRTKEHQSRSVKEVCVDLRSSIGAVQERWLAGLGHVGAVLPKHQ